MQKYSQIKSVIKIVSQFYRTLTELYSAKRFTSLTYENIGD